MWIHPPSSSSACCGRAFGRSDADETGQNLGDALVQPWLERHTKAEIEAIADQHQLTIAPLRTFAEALGVPRERWIFPWASTKANHMVPVCARRC